MLAPAKHVWSAIAITLSLVVSASAQTQTGTITGVVTDPQNAVLPGVTVTQNSDALIRPQTTVTNERGAYTFIALPPGSYRAKFELTGFAPVERSGLIVGVAVVMTVDQTLRLASWVDAQRLVFQRVSADLRTREIVVADVAGGPVETLARDQDDKWWSPPASSRPDPDPSPDGRWVAFLSDRDGWDHLYSVHQYLLQRGYVVLAVDYRGSIGYGKQWRQGHYRDLGGRDYDDVAAGVAFLRSTGYVDTARIGVWGLSYGGFMTLQALTRTPELFRCGIDVAGVDDWRDWHHDPDGPWINARMGSPQENAELYRRAAPIERVHEIVRPLLVLHGTADVNVPFYESVRLVDALLKANKRVEFMMYPGEFRYFRRAHVLRDAWQTVDRFFAAHLAPQPAS